MAKSKTEIGKAFVASLPFSRALGMDLQLMEDGRAVIKMPYRTDIVGDPKTGVIHGGAMSALMDTCGGAAVISHASSNGLTATIDLRIDYMRAAEPGKDITAEAICYHVTRSVAFVRATASDGDPERPVAAATGAFTFAMLETPQ